MGIFIRHLHSVILQIRVFFTNPPYLRLECHQSVSDPSSHKHYRYIYTQYDCRCRIWWMCMGNFIRHLHSLILHTVVFFIPPYLRLECHQSISDPSSHTHIRHIYTQYECRCRIWWMCIGIFIRHLHSVILHIVVFFTNPPYLRPECRQSSSDPWSHTHIRFIYTQYECWWRIWWICIGIFIRADVGSDGCA